jgi:hypothetical protein
MTTTPVRLGTEQRRFLETLVEHGSWYGGSYGCGWIWTNRSGTLRLLEGLFRRGLVTKEEHESRIRRGVSVTHYLPSVAGVALVAGWRMARQQAKLAKGGA